MTRRFPIRHFLAFALAFALITASAQADFVSYTMTGTIQDVSGFTQTPGNPGVPVASLPLAVGDRISWTVQYDRATPVASGWSSADNLTYLPAGPLVTNLVDQTNGYHVFTSPSGSFPASNLDPFHPLNAYSSLGLFNNQAGGHVGILDYQPNGQKGTVAYNLMLMLTAFQPLPTLNLANLRLEQVPFSLNNTAIPYDFQFRYSGVLPNTDTVVSFSVEPNTLTPNTSLPSLPEPSTLLLSAAGVAGFALRRFRRVEG